MAPISAKEVTASSRLPLRRKNTPKIRLARVAREPASPSMPSVRLKALMMTIKTNRENSTETQYGISQKPSIPPKPVMRMSVSNITIPAEKICPMNFFFGASTIKSSLIPKNSRMVVVATIEMSLIRSALENSKKIPKSISVMQKARNMPTPPRVGVFWVWELRSPGSSIRFFFRTT